jgi:hypothetical protein
VANRAPSLVTPSEAVIRPRFVNARIGDSVIGGGVVREIDPVSREVVGKLTVPDADQCRGVHGDGRRIFAPTYMNEIYAFDRILERVTYVNTRTMG